MKQLSFGAMALSAALTATPTIAQQSTASMTQEQIHNRIIELCKSPDFGKNIVNPKKDFCDEYSTDGGKTWIKAVGGASILAAIGIGALIRIRKRKEEQENTKDENSMFPRESTGSFYKESNTVADPEDNLDDLEAIGVGADIKVDNLSEAEVYVAYGRYKEALELIQIELKKNPENEKAYIKLAGVYKQMKEAAKAVIDKNPTIKDSGLLKELSNFERSLSESELKKLIETAEIGNITENEAITEEGLTTVHTNNPEITPIVVTEPETIVAKEELPIEQPVVIAHNEPEPSHITPTEDMFPAQTTESNDSLKKPKMMPGMDLPLKMQLKRRGFEVTKDIETGSIHIKTIREGSYLTVLDENEQGIRTIGYNEIYTVNSSTLNTFLDLSGKKPRMKLEQKNHKTLYIEINGRVII